MTVSYKEITTLRKDVGPPALGGKVFVAIEGDAEIRWCRVDETGKQFGQSKCLSGKSMRDCIVF